MAKIRFSINKETLVEDQGDGYILTRVPNSGMDYYLLLREDEVLTDDKKTLIAEWDADTELSVLPRVQEDGEIRRPSLKEAVAERQNPTGAISMKAEELYKEYYHYDKTKDPEQREKDRKERDVKRKEALSRSDNAKKGAQQNNRNAAARSNNAGQPAKQQQPEQPLSPAQEMAERRRQIQRYTDKQFKELRKGVRQGLNTSLYRNVDLKSEQMRELRLALKAGMDITKFNSPFISAKHMKELRVGAKKGVRLDLEKIDQSLYNAAQIHELRLGFEKKLDVNRYLNPAYTAGQMRELRLGLQAGLDTKGYEDIHMMAAQMHSIRQQMILDNIAAILKRVCEDIKEWISNKTEHLIEMLSARYQNRELMTPEQIKEARIKEAIEDIKEILIQSELLPESAYENKELDHKIEAQIEELVEYSQKNPEQDMAKQAKDAAEEVCEAAGAQMENPKNEKVVKINQNEKSKTMEEAAEEAVTEALQQQAYERDEVMEEETFEMMQ